MKILPVGNKVLVKKLKKEKISEGGMVLSTDVHGNVWCEIVALPDPPINPWIDKMNIGDLLAVKDFDADTIKDPETDELYAIVDVEAPEGYRAGQVHALVKKDK